MPKALTIEKQVARYLRRTAQRYAPGEDDYFARLALEQALKARRKGDYAIGAVAVFVHGNTVQEYRDRNAMISGPGVVDHAETRALLRFRKGARPDAMYPDSVSEPARRLPAGLSVFGSLEPCPMCVCTMTNAGVVRSVSTVEDGRLVHEDGIATIEGSASAIGEKSKLQPSVWRAMQAQKGLSFTLLATDDAELRSLSWDLFESTRAHIDALLGARSSASGGDAPPATATSGR